MPDDHKEKNLRACTKCRLVKSFRQWVKDSFCPNCHESSEYTPHFSGLVSIMMPNSSWVAKWNGIMGIPGVYALQVLEDSYQYDGDHPTTQIKGKKKITSRDDAY